MLFREPIVTLLSLYVAIIYGTLYLFFGAMPIVYSINRGWSIGIGSLSFLGVAIGMIAAVMYTVWDNSHRYIKLSRAAVERREIGAAPRIAYHQLLLGAFVSQSVSSGFHGQTAPVFTGSSILSPLSPSDSE